jgi:uncharacterized coiled-coil protein SlyX
MTIKELEKKIKKQQKNINELNKLTHMQTELMNNSVEMLCNHKKIIKSYCKNEETNRERMNAMEKCFDEILLHYAEEEYQHEDNAIH